MRYSLPCKVDGQGAWDAELDLEDSTNYVTEKVLDSIGFVHVSLSDYGRKMVNDVNVEIHRVKFKTDFVVLDYANEGEPSIIVNNVIDLLEEIGSSSEEVDKMGKANRNKRYKINKLTPPPSLKLEEIPSTSTISPQLIYYPLTSKLREKMKKVLDIRYKELEEMKPILEVLENYVIYKKKLDEILMGKERLNNKDFSKEDKVGIIKHGLPKKMSDPRNYVLPVKINGVVEMVALVDTGASVSVLPYSLHKDLGLVTIAIGSTLRTCSAIIDMGRGEDDWLGNFEVGRDEDGNTKYGLVAPLFLDIEDDMERALVIEAYFNPFKYIIVFKKLVDFLDLKSHKDTLPNPLIAKYEKKNKKNTITYSLQPVSNGDGDVFVDYSWERALSIDDEVYLEWHILTLPEFALVLGLFTEDEVNHRLFSVHFGKLEVDDRQFDHREYWTKVGKPTLTNHKEVVVKKPLMRIMHKLISRGVNLAWIIADQLYKHAPGTKESSIICVGHCVTRIASSLGYCVDDEIKKCSEPIDCEYWTTKMLTEELDEKNLYLLKENGIPTQAGIGSRGDDYFTSAMPNFYGNSSGYAVGVSSGGAGFDDEDMDE
ncbi:hypothetical protein Tco_1004551 [Tanacetum coccineum]|uniref:Peptidase A2 domain-containing protein n=1 Tax=Tanacetum coccineum TaxID=301880 RepID=A0ABQ5FCX4_9ASTR